MLSFKKQKGQGLTEFALILPLLLLLLLGIIEASRVIWAYITVQTAAREAARYAVTGRPYVENVDIGSQADICATGENEPSPSSSEVQPWLCEDDLRVDAVKAIAVKRGRTLAVSRFCLEPGEYNGPCGNSAGAFGVLVHGQFITDTVQGQVRMEADDHAGHQGLLVRVSTFYNLKMLTPIYDVLMGKNFIKLRGSVQLQNEGLDQTLGIEPPPPLAAPPNPGTPDPNFTPTANGRIWSTSGYRVSQAENLRVHLENHSGNSEYDIYMMNLNGELFRICEKQKPNLQGRTQPDLSCDFLSAQKLVPNGSPIAVNSMPVGSYRLFSVLHGATAPIVAEAPEPVVVISATAPAIVVDGGTIWATNSQTSIRLLFHDTSATYAPYRVALYDGADVFVANIATGKPGTSEDIPWTVNDLTGKTACGVTSGKVCYIKSIDKNNNVIVAVAVRINKPQITLSPPPSAGPYYRGQIVTVNLLEHTPARRYNVKGEKTSGGSGPQDMATSNDTNAIGATSVQWAIEEECFGATKFPDGAYVVRSYPLGQSNAIASATGVVIQTPASPYLTVEGGYTWPAGSSINIRIHKHKTNTAHYLEFNGQRISTGNPGNTVTTGGCGEAVVSFKIPLTTPQGSYKINSFEQGVSGFKAQITINVLGVPTIQVLEGARVPPDSTITIKLANHAPNTPYQITYENKNLVTLVTNNAGTIQQTYDLKDMPPPLLATGIAYTMASKTILGTPGLVVAETQLTLEGADLEVVNVQIPSNLNVNTMAPVTITVRNNKPVGIGRWFDVDLYVNPQPIAPSHIQGYNFPGDIKFWKNGVGPNATFIVTTTVLITGSGLQQAYGYADPTNYVYESENVGQAANPNNLKNTSFTVNCGLPFVDSFTTTFAEGAAMPGWGVKRFGNATVGYGTKTSLGSLFLNSTGESTFTSNDNAADRGQLSFYRLLSVNSSNGLEVEAQLLNLQQVTTNAKAGIEIRSDINDPSSARVMYEVLYTNATNTPTNPAQLQARPAYRNQGGGMTALTGDAVTVNLNQPVWLRIRRDPNSNTFKFYVKQGGTPPPVNATTAQKNAFWGATPEATQTVSSMGQNVYIGLFNAPYSDFQAGTSEFGEFRAFPDNSACNRQNQIPTESFPPGLTVCNELLQDRSFEEFPSKWTATNGASQSTDGETSGTRSMRAPTLLTTFNSPSFSQRIIMPDWIISGTTTLDISFNKRIFSQMQNPSDRAADKFYAVINTSPDRTVGPFLTQPIVVVDGSTAVSQTLEANATPVTKRFTVTTGINLANYAGQPAYLHLYNPNAPGTCPTSGYQGGRCATVFYFDDMSLSGCTSQPKPNPITTRITGRVRLQYSDGSQESLAGVKVWAYTPNGQVYETFSIQNGEFNFYNLPASAVGVEYTIFAQYVLVNPNDATQIETLAESSSVLLRTVNTDATPASTFLTLITLAPLN